MVRSILLDASRVGRFLGALRIGLGREGGGVEGVTGGAPGPDRTGLLEDGIEDG